VVAADERRMLRMRPTTPQPGQSPTGGMPRPLPQPAGRVPTTPQVFGAAGYTAGTGVPTIRNGKLVSSNSRVPVVGTTQPASKAGTGKGKGKARGAQTLPDTVSRQQTMPTGPVGPPPGVTRALSQFQGQLADIVARAGQADVARRQNYSAGLIGSMQSAADLYGGRSPALLGQFITGQQRESARQQAQNLQSRIAEENALLNMLNTALGEQYSQYGQRAVEDARRRSQMVSQIRATGA
jgi:hypothetical protein